MKKPLFFLFSIFMLSTYAQKDEIFGDNSQGGYMQSAGSQSFEVSFNPGNVFATGGDAFSLINGTIKYRSFSSALNAFRLGVNVNYTGVTNILRDADEENDIKELKSYTTVYGISIMPGTEKHFDVSDRISPYVGVQAILGYKHTKYTEEYESGDDIETVEIINSDNGGAGNGYFKLGAGIFTGVDYYFVKRFYVGVEMGLKLEYFTLLNSKEIYSEDSDLNEESSHGHIIRLTPGLTTGNIRLGWTF